MIMLGLVIVIGCVLPRGYVRAKVSRRGPHSTRTGTAFCPRLLRIFLRQKAGTRPALSSEKGAANGSLSNYRE
jgi:hypothetical protein